MHLQVPIQRFGRRWRNAGQWLWDRSASRRLAAHLPDFLGIGAQKAGTTWLCENLRCHPRIFCPPQKEVHFFDQQFDRGLEFYARHFQAAGQKVKGEFTPAYSVLPLERIRYIRLLRPDLRLIFLMRNPVERTWSAALMWLCTKKNRRFEQVPPAEFYAYFRSDRALARGNYERILDNWLQVFPREQLYLGYFDDVVQRPQQLLREVFVHLGVSISVPWDTFPYRQVIHKGPGIAMPAEYRQALEEQYEPAIRAMHRRFGQRVAHWLPAFAAAAQ